jgi:hypothetical protein
MLPGFLGLFNYPCNNIQWGFLCIYRSMYICMCVNTGVTLFHVFMLPNAWLLCVYLEINVLYYIGKFERVGIVRSRTQTMEFSLV